jgi:hypothetical protein
MNVNVEAVAAELTEAVYPVALRHRTTGSWVDLELTLWQVLSETLRRIAQGLGSAPGGSKPQPDGPPARPMLERLVTYFGLDEDGKPTSRRFLSYKIIAGPGPQEGSGLASIITLALTDERERCEYCQQIHMVDQGGAAAAMDAAIRYLDAYHHGDRLRKVESDMHGSEPR